MIDPLPEPVPDPDSQPFWDGLLQGEIRLQRTVDGPSERVRRFGHHVM